jgi:hypothetical protein
MSNGDCGAADFLPSPARTASTLFAYAEQLAAEQVPRAAALLLGLRWSFGLPASGFGGLNEHSLPLSPTPILAALEQRGGLRLVPHPGDGEVSLYDHLASGRPAIVAADVFYFPFRPSFRRIHCSRTVLARRSTDDGLIEIRDAWRPSAGGIVPKEELQRARFSDVPLDLEREALFGGNPVGGLWYHLEVRPLNVENAAAWTLERLAWLYEEMAFPHADERGEYGEAALRKFCRRLESELSTAPESIPIRRGASLLLRTELTSRLYLRVFLRNAAHLLGDGELQGTVEIYRRKLGHLQAAMDVLTKTVRTRRPEYDEFIHNQLASVCENEGCLLRILSRYGSQAASNAGG